MSDGSWISVSDGSPCMGPMTVGDHAVVCAACGLPPTPDDRLQWYSGVDPCLGLLPNVTQACCGHGGRSVPYVVIAPGNAPGTMSPSVVGREDIRYGRAAIAFFRSLGVGPKKGSPILELPPYDFKERIARKVSDLRDQLAGKPNPLVSELEEFFATPIEEDV